MLFVLGKQLERINEGKKPSKDISGRKRAFGQSHVASKMALGNGEEARLAALAEEIPEAARATWTRHALQQNEKAFMKSKRGSIHERSEWAGTVCCG